MDLKKWEEYTNEEKTEILMHWYHYYGKTMYTLENMEYFKKVSTENADKIMHIITTGYDYRATKNGPDPAIVMHETVRYPFFMELLLEECPDISTLSKAERTSFETSMANLVAEFVETYNNPQPAVPMTVAIIVKSPQKPKAKKKKPLKPNASKKEETKTDNKPKE